MRRISDLDTFTGAATLARLHQEALAEVEYVYADHGAQPDDVVLVAIDQGRPVGYLIAVPLAGDGAMEVWEHGVITPSRHLGAGRALLHELASRLPATRLVRLDPAQQLDPERTDDYYRLCGFGRRHANAPLEATAGDIAAATGPAAAEWRHQSPGLVASS